MKIKKSLLLLITCFSFTNNLLNNDVKINNIYYKNNNNLLNVTNIGELLLNDIRNLTGFKYELKDVQPIEDTNGNLYFCANFLPYGYSTGPHRCCMPYNDGTDYWCPVDPE